MPTQKADWFTRNAPDVRTGAVAGGPQKVGYASGTSDPPNGGQITDVDNPEPNDAKDWFAQNAPVEIPAIPTGLNGRLPAQPKAPVPAELQGPRSVLRNFASAGADVALPLGDAGIGALKGLGSDASGFNGAVGDIPYLGKFLTPGATPEAAAELKKLVVPSNTAQLVGKGIEQAAEFLIPGLGEEAAGAKLAELAPGLGRAAAPLGRIAVSTLGSGAVNKLQGGGFLSGAAMGAGGSAIGDAGKAVAPHLVEFAQGLSTPGARTGRAVLDETSNIFPGAIRRGARSVLNELNPEMKRVVDASPGMVPLAPVQAVAAGNVAKAFERNEPKMYRGAKRLERLVTTDLEGNPFPADVPASKALALRQGVDDALPPGSFNPKSENVFKGYRTPLRDALNQGIGNVVPEYGPLATRISRLIPATKPAKRGFGHLWGPGAGAIFGGYYGARAGARNEGGLPGAVKGGLLGSIEGAGAGTVLPALLNGSARLLYSPAMRRVVVPFSVGGGLQATRKIGR